MNRRRFFETLLGGGSVFVAHKAGWLERLCDWVPPKLTPNQSVALQLEFVRSKLPLLFERSEDVFAAIEKRPAMQVSSRVARIPIQLLPQPYPMLRAE